MRVNPKVRAGLLIGGVALTLTAVRWADELTDMTEASAGAVADSTPRPAADSKPRTAPEQAPALDLGKLRRRPSTDPDSEAFGPRSFRPAPPKAPKGTAASAVAAAAPPPPPPQAPPLPFAYVGRLVEDHDTTVFLAQGERNLVVKPGETIDNTYKLEEVGERALVITYLPLSQRQTLPTGSE
ncbi:MAG TPA: hypothetical protein VEK05_14965 [Burkholderiales bacterium]|nr:hypothetical protein [Burkholderiales bacterium]